MRPMAGTPKIGLVEFATDTEDDDVAVRLRLLRLRRENDYFDYFHDVDYFDYFLHVPKTPAPNPKIPSFHVCT